MTSLHHTTITANIKISPLNAIKSPYLYAWKYIALPKVKAKVPIAPTYGHGLGSTK